MITRSVAAVILIAVTIALVEYAPLQVLLLVISAVQLTIVFELKKMVSSYGIRIFPPSYAMTVLLPWLWCYRSALFADSLVAALLITLIWSVPFVRNSANGFPSAAANFTIVLYVGVPFSILAQYRLEGSGYVWLLLASVWVADSAALFVGKAFGKHKITPRISPKKSLEGYLAALIASTGCAVAVGTWLLPGYSIFWLAAAGVVIGAVGIMGDLFESVIKRGAGIKDSGHLIPGHGGMLDRTDSLLLAAPAFFLYVRLLQ